MAYNRKRRRNMFLMRVNSMVVEADPVTMIIAGAVVIGFVLLLVITSRTSAGSSTNTGGVRFTGPAFKRRAKAIGLTKGELKILESAIKRFGIKNPMGLLSNSPILDASLKRLISEADTQIFEEKAREAQKVLIFRIKQKIERNSSSKAAVSGTKQMTTGQNIALSPQGGGRYQSKVIANLRGGVAVQVPVDGAGNQLRWKKGTPVQAFFWRKNGQGFSFNSKIVGYTNIRSMSGLMLQHSNTVTQAQQRRYRRKPLERPAYFYPIRVIESGTGRNKTRKAIVESKNSALGTIMDISAGGCSLKTSYPQASGSLIKVEFETHGRKRITVFGKVINARKSRPVGGVMHIMFTKISRTNLNRINSYVYDFGTTES